MSALEASFDVVVGRPAHGFALTASLALTDGVLVLYGPSGSGKSLTLKVLAGLIRPRRARIVVRGTVLVDTERGIDVPPHRRRLGYVPQHHALMPFRDVFDNVAFGLPRARRRRDDQGVRALLDELGLTELARARPDDLSGGQRQRVALARALAVQPSLLLLDEPFASIDRDGRLALRDLLRDMLARHRTPAVFVTHSPQEAAHVGDQVTLYEPGRTIRTGTAGEILGADGDVRLTGAATALGPGRWAVREAVVEGPPALIGPGPVDLVLRRTPESAE